MNARIQRTSRSLSVGETFISRPTLRNGSARTLLSPLVLSRIPGLKILERAGCCLVIQVFDPGVNPGMRVVTAKQIGNSQ